MASINITDIEIVASWGYNSKNTNCICDTSLHLPAHNERNNIHRDNVTFGECMHGFHTECLNPYLKNNSGACPFDKLPFIKSENNYKIKYNIINPS